MLVAVANVGNAIEAEMIASRLRDAGIAAVTRTVGDPRMGTGGACSVCVEERLEARARDVLAVPGFSDEELAELSEQAGRDQG